MSLDFSLIPTATLFAMMLSLGMGLQADDFLRLLRRPVPVMYGVFGQIVLLPAAAFAIILALPLPLLTEVGLVILAACPGGATSNMFSRYAHGDVALSVSLTGISSLLSPLIVPAVISLGFLLVSDQSPEIRVSTPEMLTTLITTTALPIVLGMAGLRFAPSLATAVRGPLLATATAVMVLLIIGLGVNTGRIQPDVAGMFTRSLPVVAALMLMTAGAGWMGARVLRLGGPQERALILEMGVQNINLGLVIAVNFLEEPMYLGPTLVYLPLMLLFGGSVVLTGKRLRRTMP